MRQCPCCTLFYQIDPANWVLMVMVDLTTRLICLDCITAMWKLRNKDYAAQESGEPSSGTE